MAIEEKVIVRRLEAGGDYGWAVLVVRAVGRHKGEEHCLAMLCGGNAGKVLAALCAKQVASLMMIDLVELDETLATTED